MVYSTHESRGFSLLPGFVPAAEPLLFRQKWPKPVTPRLVSCGRRDASLRRADQLATLIQGPPGNESVPPWSSRRASDQGDEMASELVSAALLGHTTRPG